LLGELTKTRKRVEKGRKGWTNKNHGGDNKENFKRGECKKLGRKGEKSDEGPKKTSKLELGSDGIERG